MKYIISGTNRPGSRTLAIARIVEKIYQESGQEVELIDLCQVPLHLVDGSQYSENQPASLKAWTEKIETAEGLVLICPEYNGSMPGALKYFIDHWKYPEAFEHRPLCFIGLGGRGGGLRPVEHLQQIFGYRNGFIYPERVFLNNIWSALENGQLKDPKSVELMRQQAVGFRQFVSALQQAGLDANSRLGKKLDN